MAASDPFIQVSRGNNVGKNEVPACPKCRSTEVGTAAKHPTENSYWRCEQCGEVWNPGRLSGNGRWWSR